MTHKLKIEWMGLAVGSRAATEAARRTDMATLPQVGVAFGLKRHLLKRFDVPTQATP